MNKDKKFLSGALYVSNYAKCLSRKVGAVLVYNDKIISAGFNSGPDNYGNCERCFRRENNVPSGTMLDKCYAIHAEQKVIFEGLKQNVDFSKCTLYVNCTPCINCAKLLVHAGIKKVVSCSYYPDEFSLDFLKNAKVELNFIKDDIPELEENLKLLIDNNIKEKELVKTN